MTRHPMTNKAPMTRHQCPGDRSLGRWVLVICWALGFAHCSLTYADSFWIGTLERSGVKIKDLKGELLQYEINGRGSETQASKVTRINIVNEQQLNDAEDAYAANKWDAAVDAYQRVV